MTVYVTIECGGNASSQRTQVYYANLNQRWVCEKVVKEMYTDTSVMHNGASCRGH